MILIVNILFSILSLCLVYLAPTEYSYSFCVTINVLFVVQNILYFSLRNDDGLVCFEFFFMLAFWFTNFVYPVFYYPTNPHFSMFSSKFNENIITKSTAIAYLGYSVFLLGISNSRRMLSYYANKDPFVFDNRKLKLLFYFSFIFFFFYMTFGGLEHLRNVYSGGADIRQVGVYSYFLNLFTIATLLMAMFLFRQKNRKIISIYGFYLLVVMLLFISTGTRGIVLGIGLILLFTYNKYVRRISKIQLITLIVFGALFLTFIVYGRTTSLFSKHWMDAMVLKLRVTSFFDLFSDLIINNRNLYVLVNYADSVRHTYFFGMLTDIVSPIPGLARYIIGIFHVPVELITGGALPTYLTLGPNSALGLGTNMIGEAYVSFGLFGVICFMYILGWIIKASRNASEYNIYAFVIYYLFVSHTVFYPRAPILFEPRTIVWSLILIYFLTKKYVIRTPTIY